jgi:catechol 2,3-dioxygenase-like lactoylglutathione lyase family enzyme
MFKHAALAVVGAMTVMAGAQQRPAITGISFVRVYASDPSASGAFYGGELGFERSVDGDMQRFQVNELQSIEVAPLPSPAPASRQAAVGLTTRDVKGMETYLKAHGIAVVVPMKGGRFAVKDPEGNLIYFVQSAPIKGDISPRAPSHRIIHAGFMVRDEAKEQTFFRDLLGFTPYWRGGRTETGPPDWVSQHVPEGTDWIEYMLNAAPVPTLKSLGGMDHMSLGVEHIQDAAAGLARNGCTDAQCSKTQMGRDGKMQLNEFDPDLTRVEYMEFRPSGTTCCSVPVGKHPTAVEDR